MSLVMSKTKTKKTEKQPVDLTGWLERISNQLERLILCHEKQLSGRVLPDYVSREDLKERGKHA